MHVLDTDAAEEAKVNTHHKLDLHNMLHPELARLLTHLDIPAQRASDELLIAESLNKNLDERCTKMQLDHKRTNKFFFVFMTINVCFAFAFLLQNS
jgi:hypothetical protein